MKFYVYSWMLKWIDSSVTLLFRYGKIIKILDKNMYLN